MTDRLPQPHTPVQKLVHRWFVRYNPLYFFSSLSVLAGVFLVSRGLEELRSASGYYALSGTVQVYELLLLAGAALLHRVAKQSRPAVILAVLEVFFLFDWTFQTEVMATMSGFAPLLAVGWVALAILKLAALAWIFRLRLSWPAGVAALLGFAALAFIPSLMQSLEAHRDLLHLGATWFAAALVGLVMLTRAPIATSARLAPWGRTVLRRSIRAFWVAGAAFLGVHLIAWSVLFTVPVTWAHAVPFLLLSALLVRHEGTAWLGTLVALLVALNQPQTLWVTAGAAAAILAICSWRLDKRRLLVGAVLAAELAVWTYAWTGEGVPKALIWVHLVAAVAVAVIGLRWRLYVAIPGVLLALAPVARQLAPTTTMEWGIGLLAVGFLALVAGVALNWDRRHHDSHPPEEPIEAPQEPATRPSSIA
jgi:hypothetical protein